MVAIVASLSLCSPAFSAGSKEAPAATSTAEPVTIRVGALKGPTGIGMIHLFDADDNEVGPANFSVAAIPSADVMVAALLTGELDAAVLPVNVAAKLYNAGLDYKLLAVVGNGMVKVVTTDPTIRTAGDLHGRNVYVAGQGATPEFLLRTVLPVAGVDPDADLRMVFSMPYPEMAASLIAGTIQIAVLPEPFATMALKGNAAARVPFSLTELWKQATGYDDYPMSVFVARSTLIEKHTDAVRALFRAYEKSIARVIGDPETAGALVERHDMGLTAAVATAAIPSCAFTFTPSAEARQALEALLSVFLDAAPASIGAKLPDDGWYADLRY